MKIMNKDKIEAALKEVNKKGTMGFATIKQGPHAGEFVRYRFAYGNPSLWREKQIPRNPYRSGYGSAIPTSYKVRTIDQRWRRVYCMLYSNSGTCYIRERGEIIIVEIID